MLYKFDFNDKFLTQKLKTIIDKKIKRIVCDKQTINLFNSFNCEIINVDIDFPLSFENFVFTGIYLQKKVKYFSLTDILKNTLLKSDIENSRANILHKYVNNSEIFKTHEILSSNITVKSQNSCVFSGENIKFFQENINYDYYLTFNEFFPFLKKFTPNIFRLILGAKILTSSFFLNEFIDMFGYNFELPLLSNRYFNNFQEIKDFFSAIGYRDWFFTLESQENFAIAIKYLQTKLNIETIEKIPYVCFQQDNMFCENALLLSDNDNKNCQYYWSEKIECNNTDPFPREIYLNGENSEFYQNAYDFYMQEILKLKRKSINSLIIKNIYGAILHKDPLNHSLIKNHESSNHFIKQLHQCCEIIGEKIFYNHQQLFVAMSSYEINRIKSYARSKNLFKIYVANFKTFIIEEYKLRKSKIKQYIKVVY